MSAKKVDPSRMLYTDNSSCLARLEEANAKEAADKAKTEAREAREAKWAAGRAAKAVLGRIAATNTLLCWMHWRRRM